MKLLYDALHMQCALNFIPRRLWKCKREKKNKIVYHSSVTCNNIRSNWLFSLIGFYLGRLWQKDAYLIFAVLVCVYSFEVFFLFRFISVGAERRWLYAHHYEISQFFFSFQHKKLNDRSNSLSSIQHNTWWWSERRVQCR